MADQTTIPVLTDDQNRQQSVSRFFYLLGDVMSGVDDQPRLEPGMVHDGGLYGPSLPSTDYGFGSGGEVFVRGRAGQYGTTSTTTPSGAAVGAGATLFGLPPLMLLLILGGAYLLLRK